MDWGRFEPGFDFLHEAGKRRWNDCSEAGDVDDTGGTAVSGSGAQGLCYVYSLFGDRPAGQSNNCINHGTGGVMALLFATEEYGIPITLEAVRLGTDINISIHGGDKGHIGAVALAQPRPSLADPEVTRASTSVITICGHKEDRLAYGVAEQIASATNCVVAVACGIHVDNADAEQIRAIGESVRNLVGKLLNSLGGAAS